MSNMMTTAEAREALAPETLAVVAATYGADAVPAWVEQWRQHRSDARARMEQRVLKFGRRPA